MPTGDLKNELRKLLAALRVVKYPAPVDEAAVVAGDAKQFLPMLHFLLLDFSRHVATTCAALADKGFAESVFCLLPRLFSYRPALTAAQFGRKGFAERKMCLVRDVATKVVAMHKQNRAAVAAAARRFHMPSSTPLVADLTGPTRGAFGTTEIESVRLKGAAVAPRPGQKRRQPAPSREDRKMDFLAGAVGRGAWSAVRDVAAAAPSSAEADAGAGVAADPAAAAAAPPSVPQWTAYTPSLPHTADSVLAAARGGGRPGWDDPVMVDSGKAAAAPAAEPAPGPPVPTPPVVPVSAPSTSPRPSGAVSASQDALQSVVVLHEVGEMVKRLSMQMTRMEEQINARMTMMETRLRVVEGLCVPAGAECASR